MVRLNNIPNPRGYGNGDENENNEPPFSLCRLVKGLFLFSFGIIGAFIALFSIWLLLNISLAWILYFIDKLWIWYDSSHISTNFDPYPLTIKDSIIPKFWIEEPLVLPEPIIMDPFSDINNNEVHEQLNLGFHQMEDIEPNFKLTEKPETNTFFCESESDRDTITCRPISEAKVQ